MTLTATSGPDRRAGFQAPHHGEGPAAARLPRRPNAAVELARRRFWSRVTMLAVVLVAVAIAAPLANQFSPTRGFAVASGSMEPELSVGTLVITERGPVAVGDIVVYWSPLGSYQVHRVVEVVHLDDHVRYRTAGDASEARDSFLVPAEDIQGRVVREVPHVGHLWLLPGLVQAMLFLGAVAVYLLFVAWEARLFLRARWHKARRRLPWLRAGIILVLLLMPGVLGVSSISWPSSGTASGAHSATPMPLAAGDIGSASVSVGESRATVTAGPPRLWKEVALWNCPSNSATCATTFRGGTYETRFSSIAHLNLGNYAPAPTFYLEAFMSAPAGQTSFLILRRGSTDIAGSEISTTSTTPVLVRSEGFSLTGSSEYTLRTRMTGSSSASGGQLIMAKLVMAQEAPVDTSSQIRIAGGSSTTSTSYVVPTRSLRWMYEASRMDGSGTVHFEAVVSVGTDLLGTSTVRLMDRTTNTQIAVLDVPISLTAETRLRSGNIKGSLVDGREYEVEFRRGTSILTTTLHLHSARIIVHQAGFTQTLRYVDLALGHSTSASSYSTAGYPGSYHRDSEWGSGSAWFEATARRVSGSVAVRAFDPVTNAPLAGSEVTSTSGSFVRLRSPALTLNAHETGYRAQLAAPTGSAELRGAWLIIPQSGGKTYDHVLKSQNDRSDACTWAFHLQLATADGTARMRDATVSLRGDAALQDQIRVKNGVVTQSSGAAVTVAFPGAAQHVVLSNPSAAGTTTVVGVLRGTCVGAGIHTMQTVVYVFA